MDRKERILVMDDEESLRFFLEKTLRGRGYGVRCAADGAAGLAALAEEEFDLVLLDLKMPRRDGMQVLGELGERTAGLPVVMMTAYGDIRTAVQAMRLGAADFITKPFDAEEIGAVVAKALHTRKLELENQRLRNLLYEREGLGAMVGRSPAMQGLFSLIERLGPGQMPVLVQGESGTGKELAAREIAARSPRAKAPLVTLNLTALPEAMVERELFGWAAGAFTGADRDGPGLCREAEGGTLFLDGVEELPPPAQDRLLRLIEEGEVLPLGGEGPMRVDLRLITAAGPALADRVEAGRFRQDLYYRLSAGLVEVPPLRRRAEDIPALAEHFLEKHSFRLKQQKPELPPEVTELLTAYKWPGNVRELENTVERMLLMARGGRITLTCLPAEIRSLNAPPLPDGGDQPLTFRTAMAAARRYYLERLLVHTGGNVTQAAELAEISRPNLHRHIRECGIALEKLRGKGK